MVHIGCSTFRACQTTIMKTLLVIMDIDKVTDIVVDMDVKVADMMVDMEVD